MGWKKIKEHYRIEHLVQVTEAGICIGSPYIHNIIVIGLNGNIKKRYDSNSNENLKRYQAEMDDKPEKLRQIAKSLDNFSAPVKVFTYSGSNIVEKYCETPGWPNVTHDGEIMYENTFSMDKSRVVKWAKQDAKAGVKNAKRRVEEIEQTLAEWNSRLKERTEILSRLEAGFTG